MESYPWTATNTLWCSIKANGRSNITGATCILIRPRPMPSGAQSMLHTSAHQEGGLSQVVQGQDLLFRTEWTYGKDPYPPPS